MVHSCAAYNCTERYRKGGIAFHSFPTNQELRDQWIKALRRSNFTPNQYSKLCARHFTADCYEKAPWSFLKRLKEGAVPTVFEFSPCQKRKYQKKSLDNSSTDIQDRYQVETDTTVQNFVNIPIKKSLSRRKQLIIERKEFNLNSSASSGVKLVTFSADKTEVPGEAVAIENVASLPSKRFRKKKTFSSDFVSENWDSKRSGKAIKSLPDTESVKGLSNEKDKCEANEIINKSSLELLDKEEVKSTDLFFLISGVNANDQEGPSAISSECNANNSSGETYEDICKFLAEGNTSTKTESIPKPMEYIVLGKMVELDETTNNLTKNACQSTSHTSPDKSILKENHVDSNKKKVKKRGRKVLIDDIDFDDASIQKDMISNTKEKENEVINTENISIAESYINNTNEKTQNDTVSELIVAATALEDISSQQKSLAESLNGSNVRNNTEIANEINYTNTSTENVLTCSAATTSSQKTSTVFKLNLEEEEAILQRRVLQDQSAKEEKLIRLEKTIFGSNSKSFSSNQSLKSLKAPSGVDETLNDSKRKSYIGDFKVEDLVSPEKATKCFKVAQKVIREKSLEIKLLRQRERRLMQKVEELENVIYHLVEKKMNPEEASTVLIVLKEND